MLQASVLTLMWVDYKQTLHIAGDDRFVETNQHMGANPTRREVAQYFAGSALIHTTVAVFLPKDYRLFWQAVQIGISYEAVSNNYQLGVAIRF